VDDTDSVLRWVDGYEDRWRDLDAPRLVELFTSDVEYLPEPFADPVVGLPALEAFWVAELVREQPAHAPRQLHIRQRTVLLQDRQDS